MIILFKFFSFRCSCCQFAFHFALFSFCAVFKLSFQTNRFLMSRGIKIKSDNDSCSLMAMEQSDQSHSSLRVTGDCS